MAEKIIPNGYRSIVIDDQTGEVLDDAQGYGYTTAQKAYRGYYYKKNRKTIEKKRAESGKNIEEWLKQNPSFHDDYEDILFISLKDCDESYVEDFFKERNVPFTEKEYNRYLDFKYKRKRKKKKNRK